MDEPSGNPGARFLPPEPSGPEPDLGAGARSAADATSPAEGFAPPRHADPAAPPTHTPPPSGGGGFGQPPPGWQQAGQPWGYAPAAPDNGAAVAGLILSISAAVLLLLSVGLSSIISVACAGLGIYYSMKGRARVDRGETPKHRGVAQAGFITGIVALALSLLATAFWAVFAILYATDEGFRDDLEDELDGDGDSPEGFETTLTLAVTALRLVASLLR